MFDEIICIGTSFTYGHGLHPMHDKHILKWYRDNRGISLDIHKHNYPSILSKLTNTSVRNYGWCGSSLEYVVRKTDELFYEEDLSNKLLVLEYSSWGRSELYSTKLKKYIIANWGPTDGNDVKNGYNTHLTVDYMKEYQNTQELRWDFTEEKKLYNKYLDNFQDEHLELIRKDRLFVNLLYKLYHNNIKFIILPLEELYSENIRNDNLVKKYMVSLNNDDNGMYDFISTNKLRLMDDTAGEINEGHPSPDGYNVIAKKVYETIMNYE